MVIKKNKDIKVNTLLFCWAKFVIETFEWLKSITRAKSKVIKLSRSDEPMVPNPPLWQQRDNMMYQSIIQFIVLVFLHSIQLICEKEMLLLNLHRILRPRFPQIAHFFQDNNQLIHQNSLYPGSKIILFKLNFHVPNPLANISMPVLDSYRQVYLAEE